MARASDEHEIFLKRTMSLRCGRCLGVNEVTAVWYDAGSTAGFRCARCGQRYRLRPDRPRQVSDHRYRLWIQRYAMRLRVDVATAFSIAEGIMTPQQARLLRLGRGIPLPPAPLSLRPYALVLVAVIVLGFGAYIGQYWSFATVGDPPPPLDTGRTHAALPDGGESADPPAGFAWTAADTRVDDRGDLLQVSGSDPQSVLLSFCNTGRGAYLRDPLGLAKAPPPDRGTLLGVFRDHEDLSVPRAIRIYRDPRSQQWIAGDGSGPIPAIEAGAVELDEIVPVVAGRTTVQALGRR